ncbi:CBS domain-containing protein, partial [Streptomyces sp. NPDC002265]|uniref:CBS domain-containing protein n=1 Tax=Streptomyces sp. NPDC002265 TaxID=3154415 RepID=UPI0033299F31
MGTAEMNCRARRSSKPPTGAASSTRVIQQYDRVAEGKGADAIRIARARKSVERLPVVDEEDRLIGIATRRDLLRVFLRTDE